MPPRATSCRANCYGEYLESLLLAAEYGAPAGTVLQRLVGIAVAIERLHRGAGFRVHLADGRRVHADEVVLATGNPPPAPLPGHERLRGSARYVPDPWQAPPRFDPGESVLMVGTGLTMADVVLAGLPRERQPVQPARAVAARPPAGSADTVPCRLTCQSNCCRCSAATQGF